MYHSYREISEELSNQVSLEYTRDSPFFRQQLYAFEESLTGLKSFANK